MTTDGSGTAFDFHPLGGRQVTAAFNGGTITSDGGALLLRELEAPIGLLAALADCFDDHRAACLCATRYDRQRLRATLQTRSDLKCGAPTLAYVFAAKSLQNQPWIVSLKMGRSNNGHC